MKKSWTTTTRGRLDAAVKHGAELSNKAARRAVRTGKVFVAGIRQVDGALVLAEGVPVLLDMAAPNPARTEPFGVRVVFRDSHLLVVDKAPGLISAPVPDFDGPTALLAAQKLCRNGRPPKVVHRLDKLTSGLMIFARGVPMTRALRDAFDTHTIERTYHCIVKGRPPEASGLISSMQVRDRGDERRGSRRNSFRVRPLGAPEPGPQPGSGKLAITRFRVVASNLEASAVEVRLSTGRTHQIRIHMCELGCPLLGERVYTRRLAPKRFLARKIPGSPRQALHSAHLSMIHPATNERLTFFSPWPEDLVDVTPRGDNW